MTLRRLAIVSLAIAGFGLLVFIFALFGYVDWTAGILGIVVFAVFGLIGSLNLAGDP